MNWCNENKRRLFKEYRSLAERGESVQDFFGDWCNFEGYSDIGYYLGAELIRKAGEIYSPDEIPDLSLEQVGQILLMCAETE